jgi:hypothetical protein
MTEYEIADLAVSTQELFWQQAQTLQGTLEQAFNALEYFWIPDGCIFYRCEINKSTSGDIDNALSFLGGEVRRRVEYSID